MNESVSDAGSVRLCLVCVGALRLPVSALFTEGCVSASGCHC